MTKAFLVFRAAPSRRDAGLAALLGLALSLAAYGAPAYAAPTQPTLKCTEGDSGLPDEDASAEELSRRASCAESQGHYIAAVKLYQLALRRNPPAVLARRLQTRSTELVGKLASVRLDPDSLPDGTTATVGSKPCQLGTKRYIDPGKVEIEVAAPGFVTRRLTLELREGEERLVSIALAPEAAPSAIPDAVEPAPSPARRLEPAPPPVVVSTSSGLRPVGYVAASIGAAAIVAGGVTGYLALAEAEEVRRECPTKTTCSASGAAAARSGSTFSTVSTFTTIGGGALALVGLALVIWGGPKTTVRPTVGALNGLVLTHEL